MKANLPIVVAVIGMVLLVASFLTSFLFPVEKAWTPEKSQAMRQVSSNVRDVSLKIAAAEGKSSLSGNELESLKQERTLLEEKQASMQADFEKASNSSSKMATLLRWSGIVAAIGGIAAHRALNGE
jgi:hypothetical protein